MKKFVLTLLFCALPFASYLYPDEKPIKVLTDAEGNVELPNHLFEDQEAFLKELPTQDYQATFIKMFVVLILLAGLIGFTLWMIKRLMKTRTETLNRSNPIQVLEKRILSPKSILYLIEVENQKILISESHLEVRPIQKLEEESDDLSDLDSDFLMAESSKL